MSVSAIDVLEVVCACAGAVVARFVVRELWAGGAPPETPPWIAAGTKLGLVRKRATGPVGFLPDRMEGERDGVKVELSSWTDGGETILAVTTRFAEPLAIGFAASTRKLDARGRTTFRAEGLPHVEIAAADPPRVEALMRRLRRSLEVYPDEGIDVSIDDEGVTTQSFDPANVDTVTALLDRALALHARVLKARAKIAPGDWEVRADEALASFAKSEGFITEPPRRARGKTDRGDVVVAIDIDGATLARKTMVKLTLDRPIAASFNLGRPHQVGGGAAQVMALFGVQAAPTGDAVFDARFHVSARLGEATILDERVRAALLELPDVFWGGAFNGNEVSVRADGVATADELRAALRALDRAAAALLGAAAGKGYRDSA